MLTDSAVYARLLLSALLGGLIGIERQWHRCNAGLRTHILVSLGSCLIMLTSIYVSDIYSGITRSDPARIAAGVITGIGFLGAGTIIRDSEGVRGLTTAASLWVVAGIGLACGVGFSKAATATALLALVVLVVLRLAENKFFMKDNKGNRVEK